MAVCGIFLVISSLEIQFNKFWEIHPCSQPLYYVFKRFAKIRKIK